MFHVEHFSHRTWVLISLSVALCGCKRQDQHPEMTDAIYIDLNQEKEATSRTLEAERKTLLENIENLKDAKPQSGQLGYAQKRVNESKARISSLEQKQKFLEIKLTRRLIYVQREYSKRYQNGKPWPIPDEYSQYFAIKRARGANPTWNLNDRFKELNLTRASPRKEAKNAKGPKPAEE